MAVATQSKSEKKLLVCCQKKKDNFGRVRIRGRPFSVLGVRFLTSGLF
jgi:hypothetical protein